MLDGGETLAASGEKLLGADHQMVRGQRQDRLGPQAARIGRRGGHRRAGVAARRFDQDVDFHANFAGLAFGHEAVGIVGCNHGPAEQAAVGDPEQGLLEGRLLAQQGHELLGHALARQRPQSLAGAPDQDDRRDLRHESGFRGPRMR